MVRHLSSRTYRSATGAKGRSAGNERRLATPTLRRTTRRGHVFATPARRQLSKRALPLASTRAARQTSSTHRSSKRREVLRVNAHSRRTHGCTLGTRAPSRRERTARPCGTAFVPRRILHRKRTLHATCPPPRRTRHGAETEANACCGTRASHDASADRGSHARRCSSNMRSRIEACPRAM